MSLILPKTCSIGGSNTGLVGTIGVTLLDPDGTTHTARATADIYEIGGGCYGKEITFEDNWKGVIMWDSGGGSPVYASEEYYTEGAIASLIGPGALECVWTQKDGSGNPMDNVQVWITTDAAGANVIAGTILTDSSGEVTFMLDAGSYYVWREKGGYNFTNPQTWTVS